MLIEINGLFERNKKALLKHPEFLASRPNFTDVFSRLRYSAFRHASWEPKFQNELDKIKTEVPEVYKFFMAIVTTYNAPEYNFSTLDLCSKHKKYHFLSYKENGWTHVLRTLRKDVHILQISSLHSHLTDIDHTIYWAGGTKEPILLAIKRFLYQLGRIDSIGREERLGKEAENRLKRMVEFGLRQETLLSKVSELETWIDDVKKAIQANELSKKTVDPYFALEKGISQTIRSIKATKFLGETAEETKKKIDNGIAKRYIKRKKKATKKA